MSTKKLNFKFVQEQFNKRDYILLSTEYKNSISKLKYQCPNQHVGYITYGDFRQGRGCPKCWDIRRIEQRLTPIDEIKNSFADRGYKLLTNLYNSGHQKLEAICTRGHLYVTTLRKWNCGYGCAKCASINNSGENNFNWNPDREAVKQNKKIWTAWRNTLRSGVTGRNKMSSPEIYNILGYDWKDLRKHIESHPNFELCKNNYELDHIFPIKAFRDYGINDPRIINALDNLQPLSKINNHRKNRYYDKNAFEEYLTKKGILWKQKMV